MRTAHLICGPLGSGKTTFARRLEGEIAAIRFTHDELMVLLYGQDPPLGRFLEYFHRVTTPVNSLWPQFEPLGPDEDHIVISS